MLPDLERLIQLQEIESRAAVASKAIAEAPGRIAALDALLQSSTSALAAARQALTDNQTARRSIDKDGKEVDVMTKGRHDPCVGIRAVPIGEAMVACAIADHYLRHRGQTGRV